MFYLANSGFFGTLLNIFRVCMRFFCYSLAGPHLGTEALVSFGNFNSGLIWNFYFTEKTTVESTLKLNLTNQLWNLWHSEIEMFFFLSYFTSQLYFWDQGFDRPIAIILIITILLWNIIVGFMCIVAWNLLYVWYLWLFDVIYIFQSMTIIWTHL